MYLAEKELRSQFESISKTADYILNKKDKISELLNNAESLCVLGCGSSYSVAKSSALQFSQKTGKASFAIAAGDLLVNFSAYSKIIKNATLLVLSRSGSTSELVRVTKECKEKYGVKIISICAVEKAEIEQYADLNIVIPWAFDESVCQTRTVSNLYISAYLLTAITTLDETIITEIKTIENKAISFCQAVENELNSIASYEFSNAVVLADSGMAGIAEEGALAFKEICRCNSNFYNVLDVRHGPIVKINDNTLVLVLTSRENIDLQVELLKDICKKTKKTVSFECEKLHNTHGCAHSFLLPTFSDDNICALFMLYCIQLITLMHAISIGVDPDNPEGLDPWIKL